MNQGGQATRSDIGHITLRYISSKVILAKINKIVKNEIKIY